MRYIKITNEADIVNRAKLEKLGFSTKRDDNSTIGQFGSGIKFAPISALRKGIDFIFAGCDEKGEYTLRYIAKDDDGVESIFYKYDTYIKPSSFTVDAGILSWDTDFQIYREVVANAIDEAKISKTDWSIEVVDIDVIKPVEGEFSVYLSATEELTEIHSNFDKYFSVGRYPIFKNDDVTLYRPIDDSFRVYCKGVLVYSSEHKQKIHGGNVVRGLFDYEFNDLDLNEERTVQSEYEMNRQIMKAIAHISDKGIIEELYKVMFGDEEVIDQYYEFTSISSYSYNTYGSCSESWSDVYSMLYKDCVILPKSDYSINIDLGIKARGRTPIVVDHDGITAFLTSCFIPKYTQIFSDGFVYNFTMDIVSNVKLMNHIKVLNYVLPEFKDVAHLVGIFDGNEGELNNINGMTVSVQLNDDDESTTKVMLIERSYIDKASSEDLIATMVHEWDHLLSSIGDGNIEGRLFRDLADKRIGKLIMKIWDSSEW